MKSTRINYCVQCKRDTVWYLYSALPGNVLYSCRDCHARVGEPAPEPCVGPVERCQCHGQTLNPEGVLPMSTVLCMHCGRVIPYAKRREEQYGRSPLLDARRDVKNNELRRAAKDADLRQIMRAMGFCSLR